MGTPRRTHDVFKIERQIVEEPETKNLMSDLEDWFSVIVKFENILNWKNPRSSLLVILTITILFLLVRVYEPPVLLVVGCAGLFLSLADYFGPLVMSRMFSKPPSYEDNWCYWNFCRRLVHIRHALINFFIFINTVRHRNATLHFLTSSSLLCIIGFIGLHISDLCLIYLLILVCFITPKLHPKGVLTVTAYAFWYPISLFWSFLKFQLRLPFSSRILRLSKSHNEKHH
ncbi:ADP-ribosylation factor-like protein 6-interacting protein isoform 2 [Schistosoma japonicum]|uniref:ADP-ribosylation factor-like protein 6-interacting protein isoform 2 n=1 Tax=Schistosoma japonicum TaxID=6182 RepID=A0A4Z2DH87_SCHJA|nr:ADP-ribosylation factor-like protein 6-interacting protein isoform 2 [Schistosoma japonicum]